MRAKEKWKQIDGFPDFEVSTRGRVRTRMTWQKLGQGKGGFWRKGRLHIKNQRRTQTGYMSVDLVKKGKRVRDNLVHGLVLVAFAGARPKGHHASHLNGKRSDNRIENLMWETPGDNIRRKALHGTQLRGQHNPLAKLTEKQARWVVANVIPGKVKGAVAAAKFGVSATVISYIVRGTTWRHIPRPRWIQMHLEGDRLQ